MAMLCLTCPESILWLGGLNKELIGIELGSVLRSKCSQYDNLQSTNTLQKTSTTLNSCT